MKISHISQTLGVNPYFTNKRNQTTPTPAYTDNLSTDKFTRTSNPNNVSKTNRLQKAEKINLDADPKFRAAITDLYETWLKFPNLENNYANLPKNAVFPQTLIKLAEAYSEEHAVLDNLKHPNIGNANKIIKNQDGTTEQYDENGYIKEILDARGRTIITNIANNNSHNQKEWTIFAYETEGSNKKHASIEIRKPDTYTSYYTLTYFRKDTDQIESVFKFTNKSFQESSRYNKDGHEICYDRESSDKLLRQFQYNKDGKMVRAICYDRNPDFRLSNCSFLKDVKNVQITDLNPENHNVLRTIRLEKHTFSDRVIDNQNFINIEFYKDGKPAQTIKLSNNNGENLKLKVNNQNDNRNCPKNDVKSIKERDIMTFLENAYTRYNKQAKNK